MPKQGNLGTLRTQQTLILTNQISSYVKFIYSEKATKFLRNLPLTFDYSTYGQKLGEDFAKFCGLLRIYELYLLIGGFFLVFFSGGGKSSDLPIRHQ